MCIIDCLLNKPVKSPLKVTLLKQDPKLSCVYFICPSSRKQSSNRLNMSKIFLFLHTI